MALPGPEADLELSPSRLLRIAAGDWRTMQRREPGEELVIRPAGPLLSAACPGWVVVTGWRDLPGESAPMWSVAMVRQSALVGDDG